MEDYVERGFEPEALCNFVGLMGCNWHGREGGQHPEVMSMEEMAKDVSVCACACTVSILKSKCSL